MTRVKHIEPVHGILGAQWRQVHRFSLQPADPNKFISFNSIDALLGCGATFYAGGHVADTGGTRAPWYEVFNDYAYQPEDPLADACTITEHTGYLEFIRVQSSSVENCKDTLFTEATKLSGRLIGVNATIDLSQSIIPWIGAPLYYPGAPAGFIGASFGMQFGPIPGIPYSQLTVYFINDIDGTIILSGPPDAGFNRIPNLPVPALTRFGFDWRTDNRAEYLLVLDPTLGWVYLFVYPSNGSPINLLYESTAPTYASQVDGRYDISLHGINTSRAAVWQTNNVPNGVVRGFFAFNTEAGNSSKVYSLSTYNIGRTVLHGGVPSGSTDYRIYPNDSVKLDSQSTPRYWFPIFQLSDGTYPIRMPWGTRLSGDGTVKYLFRHENLPNQAIAKAKMSIQAPSAEYAGSVMFGIVRSGVLYAISPMNPFLSLNFSGRQLGIYKGGLPEDLDSYQVLPEEVHWGGVRDYELRLLSDRLEVWEGGILRAYRMTADTWPATALEDGFYLGDLVGCGSSWQIDLWSMALYPNYLQADPLYTGTIFPAGPGITPFPGQFSEVSGDYLNISDSSYGPLGMPLYFHQYPPVGYTNDHGMSVEVTMRLDSYSDDDGNPLLTNQCTGWGIDIDVGNVVIPLRFLHSSMAGCMVALMPDFDPVTIREILSYGDIGKARAVMTNWKKDARYRVEYKPGLGVYLFINEVPQIAVPWRSMLIAQAGNEDQSGRFPASVAAAEIRIGSLEGTLGAVGSISYPQLFVGNGFDFDITITTTEEENVDGARGFLIAAAKDIP